MSTFGIWLKEKREAAGMTREELRQKARFAPQGCIDELEARGLATSSDVRALAQALDVNPDEGFLAAGRIPPDIHEAIVSRGPCYVAELRRDLFGRKG